MAASALKSLLVEKGVSVVKDRWYRSPWCWAGVGVVVGAGIAIPFALSAGDSPTTWSSTVGGVPPEWNR